MGSRNVEKKLPLLVLAACVAGMASGQGMRITSSAFGEGQAIPKRYTCDGENVSPPLAWTGVPSGARAVALVVEDPDAPRGKFTHWLVLDLPPEARSLPEGVKALPSGAVQGVNDFGKAGYGGPCPPSGRHRYVFHLYALDSRLGLKEPVHPPVDALLRGHIAAEARLTGTYAR